MEIHFTVAEAELDVAPAIRIDLPAAQAFSLVAQLQLALRQPNNTGVTAFHAESFARNLQKAISLSSPEADRPLTMGWTPDSEESA